MGSGRWMRSGFIYLLVIIAVIAIFYIVIPRSDASEKPLSAVIADAAASPPRIRVIEVSGDKLNVTTSGGAEYTSRIGANVRIEELLQGEGVELKNTTIEINYKTSGGFGSFFRVLISFLPLIFFGALILFMMRQAQGSNNQTMSFGRSRARLFVVNKPNVTFGDVAGVEEAKYELEEIVEFLKYPERFLSLGARIPKGVLLVGPPGTGKTLLARAVAGEAGVPFFSISGSEFVEMFVGVGAARVRDLFDQAKRNSPCIVFVDEIDAVGRHRGAGLGGGHDEREQTLNQILVEMDGFDTGINIIVIAATNRPDILDPALLRPGRFDRRVVLDLPDMHGRKAILDVHVKGKPLGPDVDAEVVAKQTPGFSGADLANLVNEAALLAARVNKKSINLHEFEEAVDRVMAGPERKSRLISARQKEVTAYHEAGHALVGWSLPNADKVHKISIISRGTMGGYTRFLPAEDRFLWTYAQFKDMMTTAMGGRVAEAVTFGEIEITTGASNDLETATRLAKDMVTRYGMSDKLGPRTFGRREEMVFLGREITEQRDYSDKVAEQIDQEVHALVQGSYDQAKQILTDNQESLERIAKYLIQYESVEGDQLDRLFSGPLAPPEPEEVPAGPTAPTPPYRGPAIAHPAPSMPSRHNPSIASSADD